MINQKPEIGSNTTMNWVISTTNLTQLKLLKIETLQHSETFG